MALRDRLRPWHALMLVVFLVGSAGSLHRADTITAGTTFRAVVSGLFGLVPFQFTVGNGWGYAVEYHDTGGSGPICPCYPVRRRRHDPNRERRSRGVGRVLGVRGRRCRRRAGVRIAAGYRGGRRSVDGQFPDECARLERSESGRTHHVDNGERVGGRGGDVGVGGLYVPAGQSASSAMSRASRRSGVGTPSSSQPRNA